MIQAVCNLHSIAQSLFRLAGLCKSRQLFSNQNVCKISFLKALKAKFAAHRKMNGLLIFASSISIKAGTYPYLLKEGFTHSNIILFKYQNEADNISIGYHTNRTL